MSTISDRELLDAFPDTLIDHDNKEFYRGWLEHRLLLNRCRDCGRWHHPPRPMCPDCWSGNLAPTEISKSGTIHLLIKLHQGPLCPTSTTHVLTPLATVEQQGMPVKLAWIERWGAPYPVLEPALPID